MYILYSFIVEGKSDGTDCNQAAWRKNSEPRGSTSNIAVRNIRVINCSKESHKILNFPISGGNACIFSLSSCNQVSCNHIMPRIVNVPGTRIVLKQKIRSVRNLWFQSCRWNRVLTSPTWIVSFITKICPAWAVLFLDFPRKQRW